MRLIFPVLTALAFGATAVSAETALAPFDQNTHYQVPPLAESVDIPIKGVPDTSRLGFGLVAVKGSSAALPVEGWSACIAGPTGTMPFHSLRIDWPDGLPADNYDLSFAVWEQDDKGNGLCSSPTNQTAPACTGNSCAIQSIKIGLATSGALLYVQGSRARTVTFNPETGEPEGIRIPVAPAPWLKDARNLRIRLVDETVDGKSKASRFNICVDAQDGVPTALEVKAESRDVPVGTTKLTAHLWLENEPLDAAICTRDVNAPEAQEASGTDQTSEAGGATQDGAVVEAAADTSGDEASTDKTAPGIAAAGPGYNPGACRPDAPTAASSCQMIEFTLTRAKATMKKPLEPVHFEHEVLPFVDWLWPYRKQTNADWVAELVLAEPESQIQLDGELRADLKNSSGEVTQGSVRLDSDPKTVSGAQSRPFQIVLDPPDSYGSFEAAVPLVGQAGTMAAETLTVKVLMKMPVWVLPLVIAIGVVFGFVYRIVVEDRVPLYEMRGKVRSKIDSIVRQADAARDDTLKQDLLGHASRLSTGFHDDQLTAAELQTLMTDINGAVDKSITDHGDKLNDLRSKLGPWLKATRLDAFTDDLLGGRLKVFKDALDLVKEELDAEDATRAEASFEKALEQTPGLVAHYKEWLDTTLVPLPGLLTSLGDYSDVHNPQELVTKAQAAALAVESDDAAKFGSLLSHAPALEALRKNAEKSVGWLLDNLYDIDDHPDLKEKPANLDELISELDSARNQGFNVKRLRKALFPLAIALPDLLNSEPNWDVLEAAPMPADPVAAPGDQSGVPKVLSRLRWMMVAQFNVEQQPAGDAVGLQHRLYMPASRQGGYHLSRPVNVHFGEKGTWSVVTETGPDPSSIEWLVNGQLQSETSTSILINPGQQDVLRVQVTLKFGPAGKDVVLSASVMPTGLRGWEDPTKVKSRIERAQWLRTLLVGIVTVVVGTFALTTDGMGYGTLLTGLFFGLGADLTAGSIETIRQNAKAVAG